MLTIHAMSDGKRYASRHLEHNDYYAEGEQVLVCWHGRWVEILGVEGEVKFCDFEFLRQGMDPEGNFLRQRRSAARISGDGSTQSHGRHLYDVTISAPKSVSVMAEFGDDKRLIEAHRILSNSAGLVTRTVPASTASTGFRKVYTSFSLHARGPWFLCSAELSRGAILS